MAITSNELALLHLDSIVVHELPRRRVGSKTKPILSDAPSELTADVRVFFEGKVRGAARDLGFEVVADPDTASPVPDCIHRLATRCAPVADSQKIAQHLFNSQTGSMSSGLLVVGQASMGKSLRATTVIKLEKQEGVRLRATKQGSKLTFDLEKIRDLMLTTKTKVYKMGLFVRRGRNIVDLDGVVADSQRAQTDAVASFFLSDFLGFSLASKPEVATHAFLKGLEAFVNKDVVSPEEKARYYTAGIAEIESTMPSITPRSFARRHIATEKHEAFLEALTQAGAPRKRFKKDVRLVSKRLRRVLVNFVNGAKVSMPPELIGHEIEIADLGDGIAELSIQGELAKVK